MKKQMLLSALACAITVAGCATQMSRTQELRAGMTESQVLAILGQPHRSGSIESASKFAWGYDLHTPPYGLAPVHLVFGLDGKLESWERDAQTAALATAPRSIYEPVLSQRVPLYIPGLHRSKTTIKTKVKRRGNGRTTYKTTIKRR